MKNIVHTVKQAVNATLGCFGYHIEKVLQAGESAVDVFALAVRCVMAERRAQGDDFFFVQVGAHNGMDGDPIRRYVTAYHWKGILVEPQPMVFPELVANYRGEPQLIFENVAIADADGKAQMFVPRGSGGRTATLLASFNREVLVRRLGRNAPIDTIAVPTLSPTTLLSKHGVSHVDLLQVDTEGFDYQIIRMFDAKAVNPRIIRYEHIHLGRADRDRCIQLLQSRGYQLAKCELDTIAFQPS